MKNILCVFILLFSYSSYADDKNAPGWLCQTEGTSLEILRNKNEVDKNTLWARLLVEDEVDKIDFSGLVYNVSDKEWERIVVNSASWEYNFYDDIQDHIYISYDHYDHVIKYKFMSTKNPDKVIGGSFNVEVDCPKIPQ